MQWLLSATTVKQSSLHFDVDITAEFVAKFFVRNVVEITFRVKTLAVKVNNRILFDLDNS